MSGAPNYWKKNEEFLYLPDVRIAGMPEDVRTVLIQSGFTTQQIEAIFKNAYTSKNYQVSMSQGGKAETYEQEVGVYMEYRQNQTVQKNETTGPTVSIEKVTYLSDNLPQARTTRNGVKGMTTQSRSTGGRKVNLKERYGSLTQDKVLDVSNMKEGGVGVKTIGLPGESSGKISVSSFPKIVSSNVETFEQALKMLEVSAETVMSAVGQFREQQSQRTNKNGKGQLKLQNKNGQVNTLMSGQTIPNLNNLPQVQQTTQTVPPIIQSLTQRKPLETSSLTSQSGITSQSGLTSQSRMTTTPRINSLPSIPSLNVPKY